MTTTTDEQPDTAALRELADDIFSAAMEPVLDAQDVSLAFDPALWSTLHEAGLSLLTTPEEHGGSGAGLAELSVVLSSAGYHAAPVPLAETDLQAGWLATQVGLPVQAGPMSVATTRAAMQGNRLTTTLPEVPWASIADCIVVSGNGFIAALRPGTYRLEHTVDIGGLPHSTVHIDTELDQDSVRTFSAAPWDEIRLRGAYAHATQTCGALARALELSSAHVLQRVQFGRPLAKFQAVQTLIADAASALALARSAADSATTVITRHGFGSRQAEFAIAVAKIESARAATTVSRNAHQAHGAIGFTLDHRLRHFTTHALASRSEYGSQRFWENRIGLITLHSDTSVWELVTALS